MNVAVRINRMLFGWIVRRIGSTPPLAAGPQPITALSMVQHRDVYPYLLALKSFCRFIAPARVVVVADPTLTDGDRRLMRGHVPHIEFRDAAEFRLEAIPRGGCWERLAAVSQYVAQGYVIQLDADTVAVGALDEVAAAVRDGVAFTLGTNQGQRIVPASESAAWARARLDGADHVQLVAESCLDRIEGGADLRYVRGCAGFAGYPTGSFDFEGLREFSQKMSRAMPERWSEWGTEQFTSNMLVANMPGSRVLPHPKYCAPDSRNESSVFLHFIGHVRYKTPLYGELAARVSRELQFAA
jgi:hypothetical protein